MAKIWYIIQFKIVLFYLFPNFLFTLIYYFIHVPCDCEYIKYGSKKVGSDLYLYLCTVHDQKVDKPCQRGWDESEDERDWGCRCSGTSRLETPLDGIDWDVKWPDETFSSGSIDLSGKKPFRVRPHMVRPFGVESGRCGSEQVGVLLFRPHECEPFQRRRNRCPLRLHECQWREICRGRTVQSFVTRGGEVPWCWSQSHQLHQTTIEDPKYGGLDRAKDVSTAIFTDVKYDRIWVERKVSMWFYSISSPPNYPTSENGVGFV